MNVKSVGLAIAATVVSGWAAQASQPLLCTPPVIYAVPGVECNVYYYPVTDAVRPDNYAFDAVCKVGQSLGSRWTWTPGEADAGRRESLVIRIWDDERGMFEATTSTVVVAKHGDRSRAVALANIGDSIAGNGYPDRILMRMQEAGFAGYRPVGSRTPGTGIQGPMRAPHDSYGGFGFPAFLETYGISEDEFERIESPSEREMYRKFVKKLAPQDEWRKDLLRSPLLSVEKGEVVVDVQAWFGRINDGKAPDVILVSSGGGDMCWADPLPGGVEKMLAERTMPAARKVVAALRAAAPNALIVLAKPTTGSMDEYAFGHNYKCAVTGFAFRRKMHALHRAFDSLVAESHDPRLVTIAPYVNVDPVAAYPRQQVPYNACSDEKEVRCVNALHQNASGGAQYGDAVYAALRCLVFE